MALQVENGSTILGLPSTTIVFTTPFTTTNYIVFYNCNNATEDVGVTITNKTVNGFTAIPLEAATLQWRAVEVASGTIPADNVLSSQIGSQAVVTAGTQIVFDRPFITANYNVIANCYNAFGDVGYTVVLKTEWGFFVLPLLDATFEWEAQEYGLGAGLVPSTGRLSRDWTVGMIWEQAVRDMQDKIGTLHQFERFLLIDRAVQIVAGQFYGLIGNRYMRQQQVAQTADKVSLTGIRIMSGGQEQKILLESISNTVAEFTSFAPLISQAGSVAVTAPSTVVSFRLQMNSTNYVLLPICYNALGESVGYDVSGRTVNGFTVSVSETATFDYQATEYLPTAVTSASAVRKYFVPVPTDEIILFRSSAVQNRKKFIFALEGDHLLLRKGDSYATYGTLILHYPGVPYKGIADSQKVDIPDGIPIELAIIALKSRIDERFGPVKADRTNEALRLVQSLVQTAGTTMSLEEQKGKVAQIL